METGALAHCQAHAWPVAAHLARAQGPKCFAQGTLPEKCPFAYRDRPHLGRDAAHFVRDCDAHASEAKSPATNVNHLAAANNDDKSMEIQDFHQD